MKIKWLGHSAFAIASKSGDIIITDPYTTSVVGYPKITVEADIVTVSHQHGDHNDTKSLPGKPQVIDKEGEYDVSGIKIKGIPCFHDESGGKERGRDIIFVYEIDGICIAHLGDLGHVLSKDQLDKMGRIDILLIPVGGYYTIDPKQATEVVNQILPKVVIPMHYKTEVVNMPIVPVDEFVKDKKNVKKINASEMAIEKETLPDQPGIWVLEYTK
jgi:L-ascorbate metabolism protein UlaG (beta-lactamase superfamily)